MSNQSQPPNPQNPRTRPRVSLPSWSSAKDFIDTSAGVAVCVSMREIPPPPHAQNFAPVVHYAAQVCYYDKFQKRILPHFPMICRAIDGSAYMDPFPSVALKVLTDEAEDWILTQKQAREDKVSQNKRLARELSEIERAKGPKPLPGLKTLSKMDAAKRKENGNGG